MKNYIVIHNYKVNNVQNYEVCHYKVCPTQLLAGFHHEQYGAATVGCLTVASKKKCLFMVSLTAVDELLCTGFPQKGDQKDR